MNPLPNWTAQQLAACARGMFDAGFIRHFAFGSYCGDLANVLGPLRQKAGAEAYDEVLLYGVNAYKARMASAITSNA